MTNSARKNPPIRRQRNTGRRRTSSGAATRSRIPTDLGSLIDPSRPRKGLSDTHGRHSRENHEPVGPVTPGILHRRARSPTGATPRARRVKGRASTREGHRVHDHHRGDAAAPQSRS